ncbi:MAG: MMPL family transporter [Phycisphaerae bacterium]|nr:MMPL family transporter [Phycisphaerae bacterium]
MTGRTRWASVPARRPWTALAVAGVALVLAVVGISRMSPNATLGAVFGKHDKAAAALGRVLDSFSAIDELQLLVSDEGGGEAEASAERLVGFARRLEAALRGWERSRGLVTHISYAADAGMVDFFAKVVAPAGAYYLPELGPLAERLRPEAMREQIARNEGLIAAPGPAAGALARELLKDPLRLRELAPEQMRSSLASPMRTFKGRAEFVSEDGRHLLVRIGGTRAVSDLGFSREIVGAVRGAVEGKSPAGAINVDGLRVAYSGAYAIATTSERAMRADMSANVWGSTLAFQVLFLLAYRNVLSFVLAFVPVVVGNAVAFGAYSLHSTDITPITAVIGSLLAGLGIEYSIHFLTQYEAERERGASPAEACARVSEELIPPALVGCGTSIVGFLSLAVSSVASVRAFAMLGSLGLAFSVVATLALMPALMVLIERHCPRLVRQKGARFGGEWLVRIAGRRPGLSLVGMGVLVAAMGGAIAWNPGRLAYETDLSVMHPQPNEALRTQERIAATFGDVAESLIIHVEAGTAEGMVSRAHEVERRLATEAVRRAGGTRALGLGTLLPDPSRRAAREAELSRLDPDRVARDFRAALEESAFAPEAYDGFMGFLRMLLRPARFPDVTALREYPSLSGLVLPRTDPGPGEPWQTVVLLLIDRPIADAGTRDAVLGAVEGALSGLDGVTATGLAVVARNVERTVRHDLPYQIAVAAGVVVCCNGLFLRRFGATVLSCVPVLVATLAIVSWMAAGGERINMANMVAIPLIFGLGIDFGLFTVQAARRSRDDRDLVERLGHSGHAFLINTGTTILGVGTLVTTSTPAIQSLGRVMTVGVLACMVATSFVVVPMLVLGLRTGGRAGANRVSGRAEGAG